MDEDEWEDGPTTVPPKLRPPKAATVRTSSVRRTPAGAIQPSAIIRLDDFDERPTAAPFKPGEDDFLSQVDSLAVELEPDTDLQLDSQLDATNPVNPAPAPVIDSALVEPEPVHELAEPYEDEEYRSPSGLTFSSYVDDPTDKPERIGQFVLGERIGRGGVGVVYRAHDERLRRTVAVKLLRASVESSEQARKRFIREALALARISHPNIVHVYDAGETETGGLYIVTEFIQGVHLRKWAKANRPTWKQALSVLIPAARGIAAAHEVGLIHRDIKPENVMIGDDGRVVVLDFGLVRPVEITHKALPPGAEFESQLTRPGALVGTPPYMSPEQIDGEKTDARSDQFSFAVLCYELLYGARPFSSKEPAEVRRQQTGTLSIRSPRSVPAWLRDAVLRGLSVEPDERWSSMQEFIGALQGGRLPLFLRSLDPRDFDFKKLDPRGWDWRALDPRGWDPRKLDPRTIDWQAVRLVHFMYIVVPLILLIIIIVWSRGRGDGDVIEGCGSEQEVITAGWDDAARAELEEAFAGSGVAGAASRATVVVGRLDAYAKRWNEAYLQACLDVRDEGAPETSVALRHACLGELRGEFDALVSRFKAADDETVTRSVAAVGKLATPASCDNIVALQGRIAGSVKPDDEHRVALAKARAEFLTGHPDAASESLSELVTAISIGEPNDEHRALAAEALLLRGLLDRAQGNAKAAEKSLSEAYWAAEACRHDPVAAAASAALVYVSGELQERFKDAAQWLRHGQAAVERLGEGTGEHVDLLIAGGRMNNLRGDHERAATLLARAVELIEALHGDEAPELAVALTPLAEARAGLGQLDEAAAALDRAKDALADAMAREPGVESERLRVQAALHELNDEREEAIHSLDDAIAQRLKARGEGHASLSRLYYEVARLRVEGESPETASEPLARMEEVVEWSFDARHPARARVLLTTARVARAKGKLRTAVARYEDAVVRLEPLPPGHPLLPRALHEYGVARLESGSAKRAAPLLERAVELYVELPTPPALALADARLQLSRALISRDDDREAAEALAREALAELTSHPSSKSAQARGTVEALKAWLASFASEDGPAVSKKKTKKKKRKKKKRRKK